MGRNFFGKQLGLSVDSLNGPLWGSAFFYHPKRITMEENTHGNRGDPVWLKHCATSHGLMMVVTAPSTQAPSPHHLPEQGHEITQQLSILLGGPRCDRAVAAF